MKRIITSFLICFFTTSAINAQGSYANKTYAAPCVNPDFEASSSGPITSVNQVQGWFIKAGYNGTVNASSSTTLQGYFPNNLVDPNSCKLSGCCPMPPSGSRIIDCGLPGGYIDPVIGSQYPIYSVFGSTFNSAATGANLHITGGLSGNKILRLNNDVAGDYSIEMLSKTYSITSLNHVFQFAYIPVLGSGHTCCEGASFQVVLTNNVTSSTISCINFSTSAPGSKCSPTVSANYLKTGTWGTFNPGYDSGYVYHPWKIHAMDLTPYIGQVITVDIIVTDCVMGDHFGYIYFDASCQPMTVYGNGIPYYPISSNILIPSCGPFLNLCALEGFGACSWAGPNVPPNFSVPSVTNTCFSATVSGTYTLTMYPEGSCGPISRVITASITPGLQLSTPGPYNLCGNITVTLNPVLNGNAAGYTFSWTAPPTATTSNPNTSTLITNSAGVYSVTATNSTNGCKTGTLINVIYCVGVQEQSTRNNGIKIIPNPNNGRFVILSEKKLNNAVIEVYDLMGRLIHTQTYETYGTAIDIQKNGAGIYLIRMTDNNETVFYSRLVKE